MRDPLRGLPIRTKLLIGFATVFLAAYGVGGGLAVWLPDGGSPSRFLGVGIVVASATALLLYYPLRFLVRPLLRLRAAAQEIAKGDYSTRVDVEAHDEIGDLARAFNMMAAELADRTSRLEHGAADLAARKDELARERNRLDAIVHSMQDALLFFDDEGRVVLSNAAAGPLVRRLSGPGAVDLAMRCPTGGGEQARDCGACLARGDAVRQSCRLDVDGRVFEVRSTRIPSVEGWLGRFLVARDVTELVTLDEHHAHQERLAVLGEVAAVVAHELNNPLTAVGMYAQMMEDELPAESPFREHVDVIRRNVETCRRAIRELLDWSRGADPRVADVDVPGLVEDVVRFVRPLARRAGVAIEGTAALDDPSLSADEVQIHQVLVNLAMNAIQAAEGAGRHVAIEAREADGGRTVVIDVVDDGPGIPEDRRARIFEPFFTTKPAGKGTGLGLPIARRLVEAHGGTLDLCGAEARRTTFRLRLPRRAMVARRDVAPRASGIEVAS